MTDREWDRAYAELSGDWSEYVKKWRGGMTERMAIVPVEASKDMREGMLANHKSHAKWKAALAASPNAGKVSPAQHKAAMVALQSSKWPFMPAEQRSEIVDIVIAAFGLEKAE